MKLLRPIAVVAACLLLFGIVAGSLMGSAAGENMSSNLVGFAFALLGLGLAWMTSRLARRPLTVPAIVIVSLATAIGLGLGVQFLLAGATDARLLGEWIGGTFVLSLVLGLLVWGARGPVSRVR